MFYLVCLQTDIYKGPSSDIPNSQSQNFFSLPREISDETTIKIYIRPALLKLRGYHDAEISEVNYTINCHTWLELAGNFLLYIYRYAGHKLYSQ